MKCAVPEFRLVSPDHGAARDGRFTLRRQSGDDVALVEMPDAPLDWINTRLPNRLRSVLRPLVEIPRMSTVAIGAILNEAVRGMDPDHLFVNVGVWNGFTLLSGMAGNADKTCVGVDNFSEFRGPRDAFRARFDRAQSANHRFHDMDYREYFSNVHEGTIGVYLYDGDHVYEEQRRGLEVAEPFFADGCLVIVDDTNWSAPRQATFDFVADSKHDYELLLDATTSHNVHPTYWNGLMVLRMRKNGSSVSRPLSRRDPIASPASGEPERDPFDRYRAGETPLVSLIVCNEEADATALSAVVDSTLRQTWPAIEVLVADASGSAETAAAIDDFGDRVRTVAAADAVNASRGRFATFFDAKIPLIESAVHMGLGYPSLSRFSRGRVPDDGRRMAERALLAADDVADVVAPGQGYVLVSELPNMPQTARSRRAMRLIETAERLSGLDEAAAVRRLASLREAGASYVVFLWDAFSWLRAAPAVRSDLEARGRRLVENDRVLIFDLA